MTELRQLKDEILKVKMDYNLGRVTGVGKRGRGRNSG